MKIKEVIVVEGKDDTAAVKAAVDAETIETHGFGMSDSMWTKIDAAYQSCGIIVLTDPDFAGEQIRKKILARYPDSGQAYLPQKDALKKGDIGVENAKPEAIREALSKARYTVREQEDPYTMADMIRAGLSGRSGSRVRRAKLAAALGIGYGNVSAMLAKLNAFGISRKDFHGALQSIDDQDDQGPVRV